MSFPLQLEDRWAGFVALLAHAQDPLDQNDVAVLGRLPRGNHRVARPGSLVESEALHTLHLKHTGLPPGGMADTTGAKYVRQGLGDMPARGWRDSGNKVTE